MKYNWQRLGSGWYDRRRDSQMNWDVSDRDLRRNIIAIANNGGPIAILMALPSDGNSLVSSFYLSTYTFRGSELGRVAWMDHIPVSMGWNLESNLLSIFSDGTIRVFSPLLEQLSVLSLKRSIEPTECIIMARMLLHGICFVTSSFNVHFVSNLDLSQSYCLTNIPLRCSPLDISVTIPSSIDSNISFQFPTNAFLPLEDSSIAVISIWDPSISPIITKDGVASPSPVDPAYLSFSPNGELREKILAFSVSPDGQTLASLTESNVFSLRRTNSIFEDPIFSCKLNLSFSKLKQMVWCGNDSVALNVVVSSTDSSGNQKVKNTVFVGGHQNQWLTYNYGRQSLILNAEVDGVRVQTATHSDFLYKVPECLESVFGIGSCEPSAMLYFAYEKHIAGDITAYHSLRAISSQLLEASMKCIEASIHKFHEEETCTKLLKIASFGRIFSIKSLGNDQLEAKKWERAYISACRDLRIIKAVNQSSAEFNTSVIQLRAFGVKALSSRLANHRCYLLSIKICEYCNISYFHILSSWACAKIRHSIEATDEELAGTIISKIVGTQGGSSRFSGNRFGSSCFSIIADEAAKAGRMHLAILLLQHEPNLQRRVAMLLKLPAFRLAVEQSIQNRDIDLVYVCVTHLLFGPSKKKASESERASQLSSESSQKHYWDSETIETLASIPEMVPFVIYYCTNLGETDLLLKLFEEMENFFDAGWVKIMLATLEKNSVLAKLEHLAHAAAYFSSSLKSKKSLEISKMISNNTLAKSLQLLKSTIPQSGDRTQAISFIHSSSPDSGSSFEREAVITEIELIQYQTNLDSKSKQASWRTSEIPNFVSFVGCSLSTTIKYLAFLGLLDDLQQLKTALNVQDKIYWTYKIKGLAMGKRFQELSAEIQSINTSYPPISLEKIIEICIYYEARHIAAKLIPKLRDSEKQSYWFNRAGMYRETQQLRNASNNVQNKIYNTFSGAISGILKRD
ncbi:VPS16 vacuolar sorting protein [Cryptosporidium canis]|uniref:VPS16 vacuolar sorting protein n=1 Tax=Cryptosporidium canis TaxID=195482 RepID=A0ABQ8PAZ0_9CRYT|nr:VPS16 vacuolar sorting protein [Cryptosporidium canis]KAJ1614303.1 VPS16 vacuolar sorting protein [Cryptosporidium canis]